MRRQQVGQQPPPQKRFSLNAKHLFLTFPQCECPPILAARCVRELFGDRLQAYVISREKHKDGAFHLHMYIRLKKAWCVTNPHKFDDCVHPPQHGDYRACKSWAKTIQYIVKEDEDYLSDGIDVDAVLRSLKSKKGAKFETVASMIMAGKSLKEINEEDPGFMLQHLKKVQAYEGFKVSIETETKKEWPGCVEVPWDEDINHNMLAHWLNENLGKPREHKQKQLWICGETNIGKSTLSFQLEEYFKTFYVPYEDEWMCGYTDEYELAIFDEFNAQLTTTWMNKFLEGGPAQLKRKFTQVYTKRRNIPCIVLSNLMPDECYHNLVKNKYSVFEAFRHRFIVINFKDQPIRLKYNPPPPPPPEPVTVVENPPQVVELPESLSELISAHSLLDIYGSESSSEKEKENTNPTPPLIRRNAEPIIPDILARFRCPEELVEQPIPEDPRDSEAEEGSSLSDIDSSSSDSEDSSPSDSFARFKRKRAHDVDFHSDDY